MTDLICLLDCPAHRPQEVQRHLWLGATLEGAQESVVGIAVCSHLAVHRGLPYNSILTSESISSNLWHKLTPNKRSLSDIFPQATIKRHHREVSKTFRGLYLDSKKLCQIFRSADFLDGPLVRWSLRPQSGQTGLSSVKTARTCQIRTFLPPHQLLKMFAVVHPVHVYILIWPIPHSLVPWSTLISWWFQTLFKNLVKSWQYLFDLFADHAPRRDWAREAIQMIQGDGFCFFVQPFRTKPSKLFWGLLPIRWAHDGTFMNFQWGGSPILSRQVDSEGDASDRIEPWVTILLFSTCVIIPGSVDLKQCTQWNSRHHTFGYLRSLASPVDMKDKQNIPLMLGWFNVVHTLCFHGLGCPQYIFIYISYLNTVNIHVEDEHGTWKPLGCRGKSSSKSPFFQAPCGSLPRCMSTSFLDDTDVSSSAWAQQLERLRPRSLAKPRQRSDFGSAPDGGHSGWFVDLFILLLVFLVPNRDGLHGDGLHLVASGSNFFTWWHIDKTSYLFFSLALACSRDGALAVPFVETRK